MLHQPEWTPDYPRCPRCGSFEMRKWDEKVVGEYGIINGKSYVLDLETGEINYPEYPFLGDGAFVIEYICKECGHKEFDHNSFFNAE